MEMVKGVKMNKSINIKEENRIRKFELEYGNSEWISCEFYLKLANKIKYEIKLKIEMNSFILLILSILLLLLWLIKLRRLNKLSINLFINLFY